MRLTLRTLLAYLDNVLDPADSLELAKKVEESKFAVELVHRIRTSVRKLRLDAPRLEGKGMGLDPNTVAEYLDSTLPPERVPDFEKVCLESDRHLAETASCHQVLTIVLGSPAHVSDGLRERIFQLGRLSAADLASLTADEKQSAVEPNAGLATTRRSRPTTVAETTPAANVSDEAPPAPAPDRQDRAAAGRTRPEIPEYLREPSRLRFWPMALTLLLAFVGGLGVLRLAGPLDARHPLAAVLGLSAREVASGVGANDPAAPGPAEIRSDASTAPVAGDGGKSPTVSPPDSASLSPNTNTAPAAGPEPATAAPVDSAPPAMTKDTPAGRPAGVPPGAVAESPPIGPAEAKTQPREPNRGEPNVVDAAGRPGADAAGAPPAGAPPPFDAPPVNRPAGNVEVGRLLSADQVVASVEAPRGVWRRLPRGATLVAGERYVVLPTYRPLISLRSAVQMMIVGETSFQLDSESTEHDIGLGIEYGRAVLINSSGKPGAKIFLNLGGEQGEATFSAAESELAVEVRRFLPPGASPEESPGVWIAQLFVTAGEVDWQATRSGNAKLSAGQVRIAMTGQAARTARFDQQPAWINAQSTPSVDRDASIELERFLTPERPLVLSLTEKTDFRKIEVRSLAARCLASLEEFEAVLAELGDERLHAFWAAGIDTFRDALSRSPEAAAAVRRTLDRKRGEDAATLFRLLSDYSGEQLEAGGGRQLVAWLDHPMLDVRVVAFETLRRITGATQNYRPEATPERRKIPVQKWNEKLREGTITYKTLVSPLGERKPAARPTATEESGARASGAGAPAP